MRRAKTTKISEGTSPPKAKRTTKNAKRLAKGISALKKRSRDGRTREDHVRPASGSHSSGEMGLEREVFEISRLMGALEEEGIRFQIIGMAAAALQGVSGTTQDVDIWIDLPPRQYIRAINIAAKLGAEIVRNTVVVLKDQTMINFVYEVTGLASFKTEFKKVKYVQMHGRKVPVLPLESIKKCKEAIRRPKDLNHILMIEDFLKKGRKYE